MTEQQSTEEIAADLIREISRLVQSKADAMDDVRYLQRVVRDQEKQRADLTERLRKAEATIQSLRSALGETK